MEFLGCVHALPKIIINAIFYLIVLRLSVGNNFPSSQQFLILSLVTSEMNSRAIFGICVGIDFLFLWVQL